MLQEIIFKHSYRAFIMVTATFAKPYLKYMDEGEGHTELIQWRYDDIQMMKEINKVVVNEDTMEEEFIIKEKIKENILLEESGRDKWNVFEKVLEEYLKKGKTLDHLAEEYFIYPRLVVSTPIISDIRENYSDIIVGNNIDIDKIFRPLMGKTLKGSSPCEKFLKYIWSEIYTNFLLRKLNYDIRVPHSEIWFLPTTLRRTKTGGSSDKEESSFRYITQHLVSLMMDNELFKENYCVLILHSVGFDKTEISIIDPKKTGGKPPTWGELNIQESGSSKCISTKCVSGDDKEVVKCIMKEEACAKAYGKSVIILTGKMLRLGVSLPCVDIALHMDPIKSVDTVYQSMFRVLTERPGKEQGIFIDLLTTRQISFMYEYMDYVS